MLTKLKKTAWGAIGGLLLITPLFVSTLKAEVKAGNAAAPNWAYTEEASGHLQDIRSLSAQLADDTHALELYSKQKQLDWRSHAYQLRQIRNHINAMGEKLGRLQAIHSTIAPWQQKAVDRVVPSAQALAAHTEAAIAYLNEQRDKLWMPSYIERVSAMSDHAEEINSSVSTFLDYSKTSDRLKGLESQIEFTGA